ncbi:hypothetical protein [Paracidovorax anthurii]|uniref:Uncharacterized protein n=1 Tax=Paracidovorax anthurii TaxID=78229 RepID=A0A328ZI40_9BURK|nr:hypothetical protein [Paracidovorax anthurii]RAR85015.1 hypothetical protein AX018_1008108 [Paracidovorax anthurii]
MSDPWQNLRERKWMVVDDQTLRLALQPTDAATLLLSFQRDVDPAPMQLVIAKDELPFFIGQMQHAHQLLEQHAAQQLEFRSALEVDDLIERMRGGQRWI